MPVRAELFLVRVVDADTEAGGTDAREVGRAQFAEPSFVPVAGEQADEGRNQLGRVAYEAAQPAVMGDQFCIAVVEARWIGAISRARS